MQPKLDTNNENCMVVFDKDSYDSIKQYLHIYIKQV